ncbi:hypothetical protein HanXRQr2_Chr16g0742291 [Helianthus annuus]|uniref:Uncharacterized protein n=1 Tax=Helianthus annuus TaxID=4232 RepID=A0A9K3DQI0_HELAN|nr:hypothetical protein HanXRQr2_Chr16g0742291 [Helianthus annuus]KAJ0820762.1 hypothetical protein HanPSC8_Chr16g0711841 [Helianthus annuus]
MQSSNDSHRSLSRHSSTRSKLSLACASPAFSIAEVYSLGLDRYALASAGVFSSNPSNSDLAQVKQWSMLCGNECTVHIGACFSGGSREAP